jgi:hypothetical protein
MQGTRILFSTKEDAILFAEKQGASFCRLDLTLSHLHSTNKAGIILCSSQLSNESLPRIMPRTIDTILESSVLLTQSNKLHTLPTEQAFGVSCKDTIDKGHVSPQISSGLAEV